MTRQTTHNPAAGDVINVPAIGNCEVLRGDDPSLIHLKTPSGGVLKVGDKALCAMMTTPPAERIRKEECGNA